MINYVIKLKNLALLLNRDNHLSTTAGFPTICLVYFEHFSNIYL